MGMAALPFRAARQRHRPLDPFSLARQDRDTVTHAREKPSDSPAHTTAAQQSMAVRSPSAELTDRGIGLGQGRLLGRGKWSQTP